MFKKSEQHNPNYLAKIVKLPTPVPHNNANALQGFIIDHNRVWTDMSYKEGDVCIYFPLECCINPELVSYCNLFRDKALNKDVEKAGFFDNHTRIRALKLRGEPSEGFLLPISEVSMWACNSADVLNKNDINTEFDTIQLSSSTEFWICKKYIPKNTRVQGEGNKTQAKKSQLNLIVENQFRLHRDTEQLKKHIDEVKVDDIISITYKLHGTSAVFSNILVKRVLSRFERFLKWCGINIQESKHGNVYSSRNVIKDVDGLQLSQGGFYGTDIWGIVNEEIKDKILQGITIYGEIVGFLPEGKTIQGNWDYGCEPNTHELYVYRITYTNPEGHVFEFGWQDLKDYCDKFGLKYVPELYYGTAQLYCSLTIGEDNASWQNKCLEQLIEDYLEKDCWMCKNKVPGEGIVLRVEKSNKPAFKLKSFRFLKSESDQLDTGEVDIESEA